MNNIEILLINDFSKDNSLKIIEDLAKEDYRIIIINNNKNMGTLYSRCIGVLKAKGKYILALDNDDLFMNENVFNTVFQEAEKGNYDIIDFNAIRGNSYKPRLSEMIDDIYHDNPNNLILHQPELSMHSVTKNGKYEINNIHIWGKCIINTLYKKAVNSLGIKKYSYYMSWAEDTSMVFILFNMAKSYKYISMYGVFHLMSEITACYTQSIENKLFGEIFLLDVLFDFSKNDFKNKKYVIIKSLELLKNDLFEKGITNLKNKEYINILILSTIKRY
jgi:glycosyltransferase involved in cell wall biosynthesis